MQESRRGGGTRRRRLVGLAVLVAVAIAVAIATAVVAAAGAGERVDALWVGATVAPDGSARVVEVVDYDFGGSDRHGIYREVPGLRTGAPIEVSSPDAPAGFTVTDGPRPRIRIGDPDQTVSGRHRYVLGYTLDGVAPGGRLAWDAVGTGWNVGIRRAEVHVVAPAALDGGRCQVGTSGSETPCAIEQAEPGALVASVTGLDAGEGVTLRATAGGALTAAPALPTPPGAVAAPSTGLSPLAPAALAALLLLLAALVTCRALRLAGRERVPATGLPSGASGEDARIDLEELGAYAAPSPTLPPGLTAAQGGVLLADRVTDAHKAAWLVGEAVAGTIDVEVPDPGKPRQLELVRLQPGDRAARPVLDRAFRGRDRVTLGKYDKPFAEAWKAVGEELSAWRRGSGLWDAAADRRAGRTRGLGVLVALTGGGLAVLAGWLSARQVALPLGLAGVGGVLAGAGAAAAVRGWELRVLTPAGSAAWLQVESLRLFLASSPPTAVDEVLASGQTGRFTAWAIALGQAERWSQLASAGVPARSRYPDPYLRYAAYGPYFASSCATTSVSPSSSSGGGGGGVGGGAGGGGGGSW